MNSRCKTVANSYDGKIAGLYDLEDTLGRGHFAVVKLARHVFTGEKVAVKVIDKTKLDEVSRAHLFQEVLCMKLVQHPNVVRLYEVIDTQTKLYLILELGDGGDLYDYIMKHDKGLDEESARKYFRQIVHAISYCHRLHVVHRDLKPENVVFFEKLGMVKLTDFGFSNRFCPGQKLETSCGSLAYSAPEILLGDSYDAPAVDVWSLGVILYMLVCGRAPFQEANDSETLTMIMDCKYTIASHVSDECERLIRRMLIRDPEKRSSLEQIANDEWILCGGNVQPADYLPLVSKDQLSEDDHDHILQKMASGNIATKDDIIEALEKNRYNHITATYFLLAERKLRAHRQEQARLLSTAYRSDLSALAISPRSPSATSSDHAAKGPVPRAAANAKLPVSPQALPDSPRRFRFASKGPCSQAHSGSLPSSSSSTQGAVRKVAGLSVPPFHQRGSSPARGFMGFPAPLRGNLMVVTRDSKKKKKGEEEGGGEEEEEGRTTEKETDTAKKKTPPALSLGVLNRLRSLPSPNRRLHSVQSSPQLTLNEIFEETESSDGEAAGLVGHAPHHAPAATRSLVLPLPILGASVAAAGAGGESVALSPAVLRKYEHQRRRYAKGRTTSCSSSDASDEDSAEHRKRKAENLESLAGRSGGPWARRGDEDDDDTQPPGAPTSKGTSAPSGGGSQGGTQAAARGNGVGGKGAAGKGTVENGGGGGGKRERGDAAATARPDQVVVEVAEAAATTPVSSKSSESLTASCCALTNGEASYASPPSTPPSVISLRQSKTLHNISKYSSCGAGGGNRASSATHQQKGKTRGLFGVRGLLYNLRRGCAAKHDPGEATANGNGKGYAYHHQRPLSEPGGSGSGSCAGGPSKNRTPSLYRLLDKKDHPARSPKLEAASAAAASNPSSTGSSASSSPSAAAKRFDINQNGIRTGRGAAVAGAGATGGARASPLPPAPIAVLSSPATNGHNFAVGISVVGGESSHSSKCCSLC